MTPYSNTLACKSEVVHFFVNHDVRAFGANGLCIWVGKKGPHYMACCGLVVHGESAFFGKGVVHAVQTAPPPPAPPTGFGTYINSALKTSMVRPPWGATINSGRELTRGCYALKQTYHLPCLPPPCFKKFSPTYMLRSD